MFQQVFLLAAQWGPFSLAIAMGVAIYIIIKVLKFLFVYPYAVLLNHPQILRLLKNRGSFPKPVDVSQFPKAIPLERYGRFISLRKSSNKILKIFDHPYGLLPIHKIINKTLPLYIKTSVPGEKSITNQTFHIPIRIYIPTESSKPLPILFHIHGGGCVFGNLDTHDNICRHFAKKNNIIVIGIDYSLSPEVRYPVALNQCYAALIWIFRNCHSFGGDPKKVAIGGESAGGYLSASVALKLRDSQRIDPQMGYKLSSICLIYPVLGVDFTLPSIDVKNVGSGYIIDSLGLFLMMSGYIPESKKSNPQLVKSVISHPYFSPMNGKFDQMPPILLISCEYDPLFSSNQLFHQKLVQEKVPVQYLHLPGAQHGCFNGFLLSPQGLNGFQTMSRFLRKSFA